MCVRSEACPSGLHANTSASRKRLQVLGGAPNPVHSALIQFTRYVGWGWDRFAGVMYGRVDKRQSCLLKVRRTVGSEAEQKVRAIRRFQIYVFAAYGTTPPSEYRFKKDRKKNTKNSYRFVSVTPVFPRLFAGINSTRLRIFD